MTKRVTFLARLTADEVRECMRAFSERYKRDWQQWIDVTQSGPLDAPMVAQEFRGILQRWQAVRSRTKGRVVRHCRSGKHSGALCIDDLLRESAPFVKN